MEDAHISTFDTNLSLFGVFDGHGGSEVASYTKNIILQTITNSPHYLKDWKQCLTTTFLDIDKSLTTEQGQKALYAISKENGKSEEYGSVSEDAIHFNVGCTSCVALISGGEIYVANAGDSRCVMGKGGAAMEMSYDHKPSNEVEMNRIIKANGFVEDNRVNGMLGLSRAIGDYEYKNSKNLKMDEQLVIATPDIKVEKITDEVDFLVVACDGIWECWSSSKVVEFVYAKLKEHKALSEILDNLFEAIVSPDTSQSIYGCDNMTAIIVQFKKKSA